MAQGSSTQYVAISTSGASVIPPRQRSAKPIRRAIEGSIQRSNDFSGIE
jgi:hypothetical protein